MTMHVDSINTTDLNIEIDTLSFALAVHVGTHTVDICQLKRS